MGCLNIDKLNVYERIDPNAYKVQTYQNADPHRHIPFAREETKAEKFTISALLIVFVAVLVLIPNLGAK